jgi:molybdopterin molybdotransferase
VAAEPPAGLPFDNDMITIDEAYRRVIANLPSPRVEEIPFTDAFGRILAEDLTATCDLPPFDRSVMDGYAVRAEDVRHCPVDLVLSAEVRAGGAAEMLQPGHAIPIMTGAPLPEGSDAVQAIELAQVPDPSRVSILEPVQCGANVSRRGSEVAAGARVAEAGTRIGPLDIAVFASFGYSRLSVHRRPRVALIATGDELVEVDREPHATQIRNSNSYALQFQLQQMGLRAEYLGIAPDEPAELRRSITQGLDSDVVISTGGVSMGKYDLVKDAFSAAGLTIIFDKVAMRPGKPTVFARKGDKIVFGLPGNPISAFMAFENFVRPALGRMMGLARPDSTRIKATLSRDMHQKPGRTGFFPARVTLDANCVVEPLPWKGSADLVGFSRGNAVVVFPAELEILNAGETVDVVLLGDFLARRR